MNARIPVFAALAACGASTDYIRTNAALGRVVVYRNGVAFYERRAVVDDGRLTVRVPRDRVDDFLKSMTVYDHVTNQAMPVTIPRHQKDDGSIDGAYLTMTLQTPQRRKANVLLTYVTESPAWKPSYRIVIGKPGKLMLEGWAVVDNTSGEDWNGVQVGVGASSALAFKYDLWSVRTVDRMQLADKQQLAIAPPTGISPFGSGGAHVPGTAEAPIELSEGEIRNQPGDAYGVSFSGSSSLDNAYIVDGISTTGLSLGSASGSERASPPSGMLTGFVVDHSTGDRIVGVTVVASSPGVIGGQTAITDSEGTYVLRGLPPGEYALTFYYQDQELRRTGIEVRADKQTKVFQKIDTTKHTEKVRIVASAPSIDISSTSAGITLDKNFTQNIPVPGRTFESALGSARGLTTDTNAPTTDEGDRKIQDVVARMKGTSKDVIVEVHADTLVAGAERRARERGNLVRNQLVDAGIAPARIQIVPKIANGAGENVRLTIVAVAGDEPAAGGPVDESPVGESHFLAEQPVTVTAGSSAMVSLLRAETQGGVVYLYDPISERGNKRFAFRAVRMINPTDDTLEPGPVTVYGEAKFIGEGLTDSIPPNAPAVIPYALDRQIIVDTVSDESDRIARLVTLERGVLTAEVQHIRRTHLTLTSRLHQPTTVYIRHRSEAGWTVVDHPPSATRAGDAQLYAVDVPAGGTAEVVIAEATPLERSLQLASPAALDMLEVYLDAPEPDAKLKKSLGELVEAHRGIAGTAQRIETLRDQLVEYRRRSDELHAQILTLGAVKTGGELMRVLKAKMAETSEKVQRATLDIVDAQEQLLIQRTRFADILADLHLPDAMAKRTSQAANQSP